jgi:predicted O-methyltransferase YrrM
MRRTYTPILEDFTNTRNKNNFKCIILLVCVIALISTIFHLEGAKIEEKIIVNITEIEASPPVINISRTESKHNKTGAVNIVITNYKPPLFIITPTNLPHYLTRSIYSVIKIRECFDVNWIIVHTKKIKRLTRAPMFRDVFSWITELYGFNKKSLYGNHERNIGIAHVLRKASKGLVYFLDDDNTMPNICRMQNTKLLDVNSLYYADQYRCGQMRLNTRYKNWSRVENVREQICRKMDTGSFFVPISLLKNTGISWPIRISESDCEFYTNLAEKMVLNNEQKHIKRLSTVKFNYNELSTKINSTACGRWKFKWNATHLQNSLLKYRKLILNMETVRLTLNSSQLMNRKEVTFHTYVHILFNLRTALGLKSAIYVEIGIWKGATSLFMANHSFPTRIIGIDGFYLDKQELEATALINSLMPKNGNSIEIIKSDSRKAIPELKRRLDGGMIDILFIDGDHSVYGATMDFILYLPLVVPGGYIIFDDFLDTLMSEGVRKTIWQLVQNGTINLDDFDIIGSVENTAQASAYFINDPYYFDWGSSSSNEFILRKLK